jgi:hypothetical protein
LDLAFPILARVRCDAAFSAKAVGVKAQIQKEIYGNLIGAANNYCTKIANVPRQRANDVIQIQSIARFMCSTLDVPGSMSRICLKS